MRKRGMWGDLLGNTAVLAGFAIIFIILNQIHEYNLKPQAIGDGVDSTSMDLLELAWLILPVSIFLGWLYTNIEDGKQGSRLGGYDGL